jgi:ribonuclease PH
MYNKLRPLYLESSWNHHAHGSSYIEMGNTKIFCSVFGPKEKSRSNKSQEAEITCNITFLSVCQVFFLFYLLLLVECNRYFFFRWLTF